MVKYCEHCKELHEANDMCPKYKKQLKEHPEWLSEAADFTVVAGTHSLVTSQALDNVATAINKFTNSNLSYEGTHQYARDIQVFKRLNEEAFSKCGAFSSSETAYNYLINATDNQYTNILRKVNGSGQEIDWLRGQQGKLSSILKKSELLNKNAKGVDGVTINRFTGKEISQTTIKAAQSRSGLNTNVKGIVKALKAGDNRLPTNSTVYGIEGTKDELLKKLTKEIAYANKTGDYTTAKHLQTAKEQLKVVECNTPEQISKNAERIINKIKSGEATPSVIVEEIGKKVGQGAITGAVVAITVSGITTYIKYKNNELTLEEAFKEVSKETIKGTLVGGAMGAITIFLPAGIVGVVEGIAIGIYVGKVCANVLDEIYGKGAYGAILDASGYIYGMTINLADYLKKIDGNITATNKNIKQSQAIEDDIEDNFNTFERTKGY